MAIYSIKFRLWLLPLIVAIGFWSVLAAGVSANHVVAQAVDATVSLRSDRDAITDAWFGLQQIRESLEEALTAKDQQELADKLGVVKANLDFIKSSTDDIWEKAGRKERFAKAFAGLAAYVQECGSEAGKGVKPPLELVMQGLKTRQEPLNILFQEQYHAALDQQNAAEGAIRAANANLVTHSQVASGIVLAILMLAMALAIRSVVGPLSAIEVALGNLTGGRLDTVIPHADLKNEIGAMARAVQGFKENLQLVQRLKEQQRIDQEQAAQRAAAERRAELHQLAARFESSIMDVVRTVAASAEQMQGAAQSVAAAARQSEERADHVSIAAGQTTANVQTVAAAAEQLTASIGEIARQVADADRISSQASDEASRTDVIVQGLAASAAKIGEVVALINDVASQTNLLALNATIEAARAGEAGKGFAVVANEVKNLANQTARATDEIRSQISTVQEDTRRAVEAIKTINLVVEQVRAISSGIAAAVREQGSATQEISRSVTSAAQGTREVSEDISSVREAASTTGRNASLVLDAARDLAGNSERLRGEVNGFLSSVRG